MNCAALNITKNIKPTETQPASLFWSLSLHEYNNFTSDRNSAMNNGRFLLCWNLLQNYAAKPKLMLVTSLQESLELNRRIKQGGIWLDANTFYFYTDKSCLIFYQHNPANVTTLVAHTRVRFIQKAAHNWTGLSREAQTLRSQDLQCV